MPKTKETSIWEKTLEIEEKEYRLCILDNPGQESLKNNKNFDKIYGAMDGIIVVFDITHKISFDVAKALVKEILPVIKKKTPIVILGNKLDKENELNEGQENLRRVEKSVGLSFANELNLKYFETSARPEYKLGVNQVFEELTKDILKVKEEKMKEKMKKKDDGHSPYFCIVF